MISSLSPCAKKTAILPWILLFSFFAVAQPKITSVTPAAGSVGTVVAITGSGFVATTTGNLVYFGTIKASVSSATTTSLSVTVPAGAGFDNISVVSSFYTAYSSQPFKVTFPGGSGSFAAHSFAPKKDIPTSANPFSVSTGDIDGDGKPDMVVANTASNSISIFLNTSTGGTISFAPKIDLPTGLSPHRICIADISGDGKPELIVTNYDNNSISIFRNNSTPGTITFSPKTDVTTGANPEAMAVGDLDGNGTSDLVVTNSGATSITIFKNNAGSGGGIDFSNPTTIAYGGSPSGIALGDLDADGKTDIVITNWMTDKISVFRNTSAGGILSFASHTDLSAFTSPQQVNIADLDGDGKPDLVASGNQTIAVLQNNCSPGNISFAGAVSVSSVPDVYSTIADLDGDGKPDIAASAQFSRAAYALKNESVPGSLLFDAGQFYAAGNDPTCISAADFDGDGKPDLVLSNISSASVSVIRNKINEPFISAYTPIGGCPVSGSTIQINGSNFTSTSSVKIGGVSAFFSVLSDSVLQATLQGPLVNNISVSNAYGTDSFKLPAPIISSFSPTSASPGISVTVNGKYFCGATSVSFGGVASPAFTVNGDSSITAIVGPGASGSLSITTIAGTGSLPGFTFIPLPVINSVVPQSGRVGTPVSINGKNFSKQSINDIVYFGAVRATVVTASDSLITVLVPPGASYQPVSVTNRDHNLIAYAAQPFITLFGSGHGLDSSSFRIKQGVAQTGQFPIRNIINDMDQDGSPDLISADFVTGSATVMHNSSVQGNISFPTKNTFTVGSAGQTSSVGSADYDGDGRNDLAVVNKMDTNIVILKNISGPGHISFLPAVTIPAGYESWPSNFASGDLDGDGKPDLVVLNDQYGRPSIFRNMSRADSIFFAAPIFLNTFSPIMSSIALADFDGDGKPDIAITDRSYNVVYVYLNKSVPGIISFANLISFPAGFGVTSIVAGDLDGDHRPDIIFSNPGNSSFSILRNLSTPGNISFSPKADFPLFSGIFSVAADNISIADVDGDGMADICLTTETSVMLFKNTSSAGNISLATPVSFDMPYGYNGNFISVNDLNNDGKPEMAVTSQNSTNVTVFLNETDSASTPVINSFLPGTAGFGDTVTIKGSHFNGSTSVSFGGIPAMSFQVPSDSVIIAVVGKGASGNVRVTNASSTATVPGFIYPGLVINSFSPSTGTTGTTVTILGKYFSSVTAVSFGGTGAISFTIVSDSVITAVVGMGSSGSISAITPDHEADLGGFTFVAGQPPVLTYFTPLSGSTGTLITIHGNHLSGVTAVSFGGVAAASFYSLADTIIVATVGAGATGAVYITTGDGTDTLGGFQFINNLPLHITSFTPAAAAAGQTVTIKGQQLTGPTSVSFGGVPAASFVVLSDSSLQAIVGNGASGTLMVQGASGLDSLNGFVFLTAPQPAPVINHFTPDSAGTGASVAINGLHFTGTTVVSFGNTAASSFTVISDSLITATLGTGSSGDVRVVTATGADSLSGFIFINAVVPPIVPPAVLPPAVHAFTPHRGNSGTLVTITGTNFTGANSVTFGSVAASSFNVVSDSVITAVVGGGASGSISVTSSSGVSSLDGFVFTTGLNTYPNPATGFITINFPASESNARITIADMTGRSVLSVGVEPHITSATVNISGIKAGIYILYFKTDTSTLAVTILIR